jgi:hypothetical protein
MLPCRQLGLHYPPLTYQGHSMSSAAFFSDPEPLLSVLAEIFAGKGAAKLVAILASAKATVEVTDTNFWSNEEVRSYTLFLEVPTAIYNLILDNLQEYEDPMLEQIQPLLRRWPNDQLRNVAITPLIAVDENWRDKAKAWLAGDGVSNQGRVRSDNLPSRSVDGLLFRSVPEIHLYRSFKSLGVSFAPLPVFVRGGETYRRIEPDFVLVKDGVTMVVEVDGDTVHTESPAEAHDRITMLAHEGVKIERVRAENCSTPEKAMDCAKRLLAVVEKLKNQR